MPTMSAPTTNGCQGGPGLSFAVSAPRSPRCSGKFLSPVRAHFVVRRVGVRPDAVGIAAVSREILAQRRADKETAA